MLDSLSVKEAEHIGDLAEEVQRSQEKLLNKMQSDGQQRPDAIREDAYASFAALKAVDDGSLQSLEDAIRALSAEARHELTALMLVGRGEYAAKEWSAAMQQAEATPPDTEVERLIEKSALASYLNKGLYELGLR